jgi:predicted membrane protein
MGSNFGYVVLIIFILIRVLIAAGLFYLIVAEVRRYKRRRVRKDREDNEDADGKDVDSSTSSRN